MTHVERFPELQRIDFGKIFGVTVIFQFSGNHSAEILGTFPRGDARIYFLKLFSAFLHYSFSQGSPLERMYILGGIPVANRPTSRITSARSFSWKRCRGNFINFQIFRPLQPFLNQVVSLKRPTELFLVESPNVPLVVFSTRSFLSSISSCVSH